MALRMGSCLVAHSPTGKSKCHEAHSWKSVLQTASEQQFGLLLGSKAPVQMPDGVGLDA